MKWMLIIAAAVLVGLATSGWLRGRDGMDDATTSVDVADPDFRVSENGRPAQDQPRPVEVPEPIEIDPSQTKPIVAKKSGFDDFTWDSGDALTNGAFVIVKKVLSGKVNDENRGSLEDEIEKLLLDCGLGDDVRRQEVAVSTVSDLLDQASRFGGLSTVLDSGLSPQQEQAIRSVSQSVAADFRKRIVSNSGAGEHDGTLRAAVEFDLPPGYDRATWKVLGGWEYKEGQPLAADAVALHGKKVAISGYMMALGEYADIHKFLLVESQWTCCFGVPPDAHQVVMSRIPKDRPGIELTSMPVLLLGTLDVGEERDGRWVTSVYRIVCDDVIEIE